MEKECAYCWAAFLAKSSVSLYCSGLCTNRAKYERKKQKAEVLTKQCVVCGESYTTINPKSICCSSSCKGIYVYEVGNEKRKKTIKEKYWVDNVFQSDVVKGKITKRMNELYWVDNASQSGVIKEKKKKTNKERFWVEWGFASKEVKEKIKQTNLKKRWVDHISKDPEIVKQRKQTSLERYWVEQPQQLEVVKEKQRSTMKERYWVEYTWQSPELYEKMLQSTEKRWGTRNINTVPEIRERARQTNQKKYGVDSPLQNKEIMDKIIKTNTEKYGVPYACLRHEYRAWSKTISSVNKKMQELLWGWELEFVVEDTAFDLKFWDTLIDINPYAYHNMDWHPFDRDVPLDKHLKKSEIAWRNGYNCIQIFDWDDMNKVASLLKKDKRKLYARELEVRNVSQKETRLFLEQYHLQWALKAVSLNFGLYHNDELIMITTWGKPRYNKKEQYELYRLCTKPEYIVVWGFEKLFKHFLENYDPTSIVSYCDLSKFNWEVYRKNWFKEKKNAPSIHYYNYVTEEHITNNLLVAMWFDRLIANKPAPKKIVLTKEIFRDGFTPVKWEDITIEKWEIIPAINSITPDKSTDNTKLMIAAHFCRVPDCGQSTFIRTKSP